MTMTMRNDGTQDINKTCDDDEYQNHMEKFLS